MNEPEHDQRNLPPGHKGIRLGAEPTTSLVVASFGDRPRLERLLGSIAPACEARKMELVVARSCAAEEYRALAAAWPRVLFMPALDNATPRQLRAIGLSAADGDIVTLVDDDREIDGSWIQALPPAAAAATGD